MEGLPDPKSGREYYYDAHTPGLAVSVSPGGAKKYLVYGKPKGSAVPVRCFIGDVKHFSIAEARVEANKIKVQLARGINPVAEARMRRTEEAQRRQAEKSLGELFALYLDDRKNGEKPMRSWANTQNMFDNHLEKWKNRAASTITSEAVKALHSAIGRRSGRHIANRVLELLHAMYRYAVRDLKWAIANPATGIKPFEELPRNRSMSLAELSVFRTALEQEPDETWRDFFNVTLFSGARRGNVQAMRFDQIDFENKVWIVPPEYSKNRKEIRVELSPFVMQILERRLQGSNSAWVFPSRGNSHHIVEPKAAWGRILERAEKIELAEWLRVNPTKSEAEFRKQKRGDIRSIRMHDLRRTLATLAAKAGASLLEIGAMLGHERGSKATLSYAYLVDDFTRKAMLRTTRLIETSAPPLELQAGNGGGQ